MNLTLNEVNMSFCIGAAGQNMIILHTYTELVDVMSQSDAYTSGTRIVCL